MSCSQLVGYAQQDAHEFFIGALNGIHTDIAAEADPSDPHACSCVIHETFAGLFESRVTCLHCGNQNKVTEPFLDISLDIRPLTAVALASPVHTHRETMHIDLTGVQAPRVVISDHKVIQNTTIPVISRNVNKNNLPPPVKTHGHDSFLTLYECLDLFTHQERLSSAEYKCSECQKSPGMTPAGSHRIAGATKQVSLKKLPKVLSLQLKRFDHRQAHFFNNDGSTNSNINGQDNAGAKLDLMIRFPLDLDVTCYTTAEINKTRGTKSLPECMYTLFAVIVHEGTLHSGHYTCFVRQSGSAGGEDDWFRIDDAMVTVASWQQVAACQAYMCFYIQKF